MSATILVCDDSATVRQQVGSALKLAGYKVVEACDGNDGKNKIKAGGIDCVISDVNMPNKTGIEMIEEVKSEAAYKKLPIIMLTTEGAPQLVQRAKAAGATGWIVKPFKADLLVAAVKKLTS
jgi:two-component system, chemotaxis family, chemotaxis protein CheY